MKTETEFNLAELRGRLALTQTQLAGLLGVSSITVIRCEAKGTIPKVWQLALTGLVHIYFTADAAGLLIPVAELQAYKQTSSRRITKQTRQDAKEYKELCRMNGGKYVMTPEQAYEIAKAKNPNTLITVESIAARWALYETL